MDNLTLEKTANLVIIALNKTPSSVPPEFADEYVKYIKSGQVGQVKVISKLLATQFLEAGVGPGANIIIKKPPTTEKTIDEVKVKVEPNDKEAQKKVNVT